jgi:3-hydroxyacyl-[acyl-carrier-protein] dehydratase
MPSAHTTVALDHPAFAGHFPGQPLLPGVALLAELIEALRADAEDPGVSAALDAGFALPVLKFLSPVLPGDRLRIEWTRQGARLRFELWCERAATLAASGQLELRA